MNFYLEIIINPQPEIPFYFLWEKVFQQIHLALVEVKDEKEKVSVGISFPEYDACQFQLGCKMRLFAENKEELEKLDITRWLSRLSDYVHLKSIAQVPVEIMGHACFKHVKMRGNKEKLARRRAKRKGETLPQALSHFADYKEPRCRLPYINMMSLTNGQRFRLFIERQTKGQKEAGFYSCYGLSNSSTVPLF